MEEPQGIKRLERRLYSREETAGIPKRAELSPQASDITRGWKKEETPSEGAEPRHDWNASLRIFLWGSVIFFVGSLAIAGFVFLRGGNIVSSDNISFEIIGPSLVDGGKQVTLHVIVKNDNQVPLELADLIVRYPEGTRSAEDVRDALPELRESLGTIGPGEQVKTVVSAILFGEEGARRSIGASLEYRVQGSNAVFVKEGGIDLTIGSSPVTLLVEGADEVNAGKETEFTLTVSSNSPEPVRGVVVEAEYPFGFEVTNTSPETVVGDALWQLGDLSPRETQTIHVSGTLEAQDNEERIFRFSVGSQKSPTDVSLAVPFVTIPHALTVKRGFITGDISVNNNNAKTVSVESGKSVNVDLAWKNNFDAEVYDVEIRAILQGEAFDRSSISAPDGFYRSADSSIVWNRETDESLAAVPSQETNSLSFSLTPRNTNAAGGLLKNPEFSITMDVSAKRLTEDAVPNEPTPLGVRRVLVASPLTLGAVARRFSGPFVNGGPLPPKVNQETTYTIEWSVKNPSNTVANARVTAALPPSVRFLNNVSPGSEDVSLNTSNKLVTWNLGEIRTGSVGRTMSFQVGLTPSISQIGESPMLVGEATLTGDDRFAQTKVTAKAWSVSTRVSGEAGFTAAMEGVTE
ncbi:MAG TPA: hypothetical protein VJG29_02050 [Candidatus Paceibacterota bacterium]